MMEAVGGAEDGSLLVFLGSGGRLGGVPHHRLFAHQKSITALAWNERTERLASASSDGRSGDLGLDTPCGVSPVISPSTELSQSTIWRFGFFLRRQTTPDCWFR
jgi:hypothetical protein